MVEKLSLSYNEVISNFLVTNSDNIFNFLKISGIVGVSISACAGGVFLYKKWSSKGNDNSGDSIDTTNNTPNSHLSEVKNTNLADEGASANESSCFSSTSSESNPANNIENTTSNDETIEEGFNSIESLDPLNIFKNLEDKLDNYNRCGSNEEFSGDEYINLILDLRDKMCFSGTKDISKFLQDFDIEKAVEFFSISPGPYKENVENLINMEGAIEYFSLFRLSEFTIEGIQTFDYGTFRNLFLAASALTLVKMIKDGNLPKELYSMKHRLSSVKKINFLSRFSIQDYFRLFKESFLSILFDKGFNSFYCPKKNGVRIIEKVVFNKTNMKLFFQYEKSPDLMNENLYFCTKRASRAYWLDSEHSISHALDYSSNPAFGYYFIMNHWHNAKKFDHGKFYVYNTDRKLNTELPVVSYPHAKKSPYIICLWDYAMSLKNLIHDISVNRGRPKLESIMYNYNNLLRSLAPSF